MRLVQGLLASLFPPAPEPISELREGVLATIRGQVLPRDLIESPLTGDRGVYYHYAVEEWRRSLVVVSEGGFWSLAERDEAIAEFYVCDETGRAIVAPHRARVERCRDVRPMAVDLGMLGRRAHQLVIAPGDTVEVTGIVERAQDIFDEGRDYRTATSSLLLRAPSDDSVVIRLIERVG